MGIQVIDYQSLKTKESETGLQMNYLESFLFKNKQKYSNKYT